ncbi:hypothetical protein EDB84DRAFT_1549632 [Lactarius hengduanensis]|nr:hypothetical protein EDB84DRAFT_1549632 [Lactarius hengduanensis]
MRCLVRLVSRISSDASPVLRCACGNKFLGFTVRGLVSPLSLACPVGLPFDLCAHGCALSCQLPLTRHIGRNFDGLSEGYSEDSFGVSLWENYIGFALGSFGQGPLGPLCQRDEVYIEPTSIILWMRPVRHPLCAVSAAFAGMSGLSPAPQLYSLQPIRLDIGRFCILPDSSAHGGVAMRSNPRHQPLVSLPKSLPLLPDFFWASAAYTFYGSFTDKIVLLVSATPVSVGQGFAHCGEQLAQIGNLFLEPARQ